MPLRLSLREKERCQHHGRNTSVSGRRLVGLWAYWHRKVRFRSQRNPFHFAARFWRIGWSVDAGGSVALRGCWLLYNDFSLPRRVLKFEYIDLQVEVDGVIRKSAAGYSFGEVSIRANLTISQEDERAQAIKLLHKAKEQCLVSRALALEQRFEPSVQVGEPRVETSRPLPVSHKDA